MSGILEHLSPYGVLSRLYRPDQKDILALLMALEARQARQGSLSRINTSLPQGPPAQGPFVFPGTGGVRG